MKETGIIMSGDHPKLILDGIKAMTRRVIKPTKQTEWLLCSGWDDSYIKDSGNFLLDYCPYGQVGDRLWVTETWRTESFMAGEPLLFGYKDGQTKEENEYSDTNEYESWYERVCIQSTEDAEKAFAKGLATQDEGGCYHWDIGNSPCRWRPSIFMPRWASRILLEITEVGVERLQEITPGDILKEGVSSYYFSGIERKADFKVLWDSLNAKRGFGWDTNCWVWVISFKLIKGGLNADS